MNRETLSLSVVVATRDRPSFLSRCLDALLSQDDRVDEVVVVDQSEGTETAAVCGERGSLVRRISDAGKGLARAHNLGIAAAQGDLIALVDDDCYAEPSWASGFRGVFERHPNADGAFGEMVAGGDVSAATDGMEVSTISFARERMHRGRRPPYWVGFGGNMVLRRATWRELGAQPCDEWLDPGSANPGAGDMDLIYRLLSSGRILVSTPSARVEHDQWRPRGALVRKMYGYGRGAGAFLGKHVFSGDPYAILLLVVQLGADLKLIASGFKRRSQLRCRAGTARFAGTFRGLVAGVSLARKRTD